MPNFEHYSKSVYEPVHESSSESRKNGLGNLVKKER